MTSPMLDAGTVAGGGAVGGMNHGVNDDVADEKKANPSSEDGATLMKRRKKPNKLRNGGFFSLFACFLVLWLCSH